MKIEKRLKKHTFSEPRKLSLIWDFNGPIGVTIGDWSKTFLVQMSTLRNYVFGIEEDAKLDDFTYEVSWKSKSIITTSPIFNEMYIGGEFFGYMFGVRVTDRCQQFEMTDPNKLLLKYKGEIRGEITIINL